MINLDQIVKDMKHLIRMIEHKVDVMPLPVEILLMSNKDASIFLHRDKDGIWLRVKTLKRQNLTLLNIAKLPCSSVVFDVWDTFVNAGVPIIPREEIK